MHIGKFEGSRIDDKFMLNMEIFRIARIFKQLFKNLKKKKTNLIKAVGLESGTGIHLCHSSSAVKAALRPRNLPCLVFECSSWKEVVICMIKWFRWLDRYHITQNHRCLLRDNEKTCRKKSIQGKKIVKSQGTRNDNKMVNERWKQMGERDQLQWKMENREEEQHMKKWPNESGIKGIKSSELGNQWGDLLESGEIRNGWSLDLENSGFQVRSQYCIELLNQRCKKSWSWKFIV